MRALLIAALAVLLGGPAAGQPQVTAYRDVTLIDGLGGPARPSMTLVVEGERIAAVLPTGAFDAGRSAAKVVEMGIRPGKKTAEFIDTVLTRLTVIGSIYLSSVCVLPTILIAKFNIPFYFGGTALLIIVGVAIDTISQIESHLHMRNYEGFMKQGRIQGRK